MIAWWKLRPVLKPVHSGLQYLQRMALAGIAAAYALPVLGVTGSGISICWSYNIFRIPCPGCGLTRSVVSFFHLDFQGAFFYNPFGIVIALIFALLAISAFNWPLANLLIRFRRPITWTSNGFFIILFVGGVVRILVFLYAPDLAGQFAIVNSDRSIFELF